LVRSNIADDTNISFAFDVLEDESEEATLSKSVTVKSDSPLELTADPLQDRHYQILNRGQGRHLIRLVKFQVPACHLHK